MSNHASFFDIVNKRVFLMSQLISEEAIGRQIGGALLIVTDKAYNFCDLELSCDAAMELNYLQFSLPSTVELNNYSIEVDVDQHSQVFWGMDSDSRSLIIKVGMEETSRWMKLGEEHVLVGLSSKNLLSSIFCADLIRDPDGSKQLKWIDWIEAKNGL